eukprot:m.198324 g.198324  ORF g.198324 m.198324 type:complete len:293 (-) comp15291_c0_seq9:1273-2151(-)
MAGQIYTSGLDVNAVHEKIAELDRSLAALKQAIPTSRRNGRVLRGGKEKLGKEITGRLLLLTVLWQVLNVGLLTLLDMTTPASVFSHGNNYFELGIVLMVACQLLHLLIMVASTVKLAKQLLHHTATSSFLFQSYLSTIVLYAGIYTLLHRYQPDSWSGAETGRALSSEDYVVKSFIIFLYYSTTTITSTGYGDVYPEAWYLYLLVSSEMLLGVLYQAGIFSRGIDLLINRAIDRKETRVLSRKWWHWPRRSVSMPSGRPTRAVEVRGLNDVDEEEESEDAALLESGADAEH